MLIKYEINSEENEKLNGLTGYVKFRPLKHNERMKLFGDMNLNVTKEGEIKDEDMNIFQSYSHMIDIFEKQVEEVEIKHEASGTVLKDIETLMYYRECQAIVNEVAQRIMRGISLGEG